MNKNLVYSKLYSTWENAYYYCSSFRGHPYMSSDRSLAEVYCPLCKQVHPIDNNFLHEYEKHCPGCKQHLEKNKLKLLRAKDSYDVYLRLATIFDDGHSLSLVCFFEKRNIFNHKMVTQSFKVRWTFNVKTGQSYYFGPKNEKGKLVSIDFLQGKTKKINIQNISYGHDEHLFFYKISREYKDVFEVIYEQLANKVNEFHQIKRPTKATGFYELGQLTFINRWPFLNYETSSSLEKFHPYRCMGDQRNRYSVLAHFKTDIKEDELMNRIIQVFNLPNKKRLRELIAYDLGAAMNYKTLELCGITNYDHAIKILTEGSADSFYYEPFYVGGLCFRKNIPIAKQEHLRSDYKFLYYYSRFVGQKEATRLYLRSDHRLIKDLGVSFSKIFVGNGTKDHQEKNKAIIEIASQKSFYHKKTLKKIHDDLAILVRQLSQPNLVFDYTEKELSLEQDLIYNGKSYQFKLPKDSKELVKIGTAMNHCVGGYDELVYKKQSIIVILKINGKLDVCISIKDKGLEQVKRARNRLVSDKDTFFIIEKWRKANLLLECRDLRRKNLDESFEYNSYNNIALF